MIWGKIFKKKEVVETAHGSFPPAPRTELPSELERFRLREPMPRPDPRAFPREEEFRTFARAEIPRETRSEFPEIGVPMKPEEAFRERPIDKIDYVLQKLETIEERLKVIEERLVRR